MQATKSEIIDVSEEQLANLRVIAETTGMLGITCDEFLELLAYVDTLKRNRFATESGETHWDGCYVDHYRCAMRHIIELDSMIRFEWWMHHGCSPSARVGDGGMHCSECGTDFRMTTLPELNRIIDTLRYKAFEKARDAELKAGEGCDSPGGSFIFRS
jgi:hypothetical protein